MDLLNEYNKLRIESFKAVSARNELEKTIGLSVSEYLLKKYKDETLLRNGLEYKLAHSSVTLNAYSILNTPTLNITLGYFCSSKLPKYKRERLKGIIAKYEDNGRFPYWDSFKIPVSEMLHYKATLNEYLNGNLSLKID